MKLTTTPIPDQPEEAATTKATTSDDHTLSHSADATGQPRLDLRQRLAAIAQPRPTDTPAMAALRALLRDDEYIAGIIADVENWPPLTTEQRETVAALLRPHNRDPHSHHRQNRHPQNRHR